MPNNQLPKKLLLDPREAADALSISERHLWSLTASGSIPCIRIGRSKRYFVDDLREWIAEKKKESTTCAS